MLVLEERNINQVVVKTKHLKGIKRIFKGITFSIERKFHFQNKQTDAPSVTFLVDDVSKVVGIMQNTVIKMSCIISILLFEYFELL